MIFEITKEGRKHTGNLQPCVIEERLKARGCITAWLEKVIHTKVSQLLGEKHPVPVRNLTLPDAPVITGTSPEIFAYYGLDCAGICKAVKGE